MTMSGQRPKPGPAFYYDEAPQPEGGIPDEPKSRVLIGALVWFGLLVLGMILTDLVAP